MSRAIVTGALASTFSLAVVLALAALGELVQERAGILNLGLEGVVISGALGGFAAAFYSHNVSLGFLAAAATAALIGALFATLVVFAKMDQVIVGILFVTLITSLATVVWGRVFGVGATPPRLQPLARIAIPLLSNIPVVGPAVFDRILPEYLAIGLIGIVTWLLYRTRIGLAIRASGDAPDAVDFTGGSVAKVRFFAVVLGCAIAGLGGALLTVGQLGFYAPGVTAGRGWIAIAIVIMAGWKPWGTLGAALIFGGADMLQVQVQAAQWGVVPFEFLLAFPFFVAIFTLIVRRSTARAPRSLGVPYVK